MTATLLDFNYIKTCLQKLYGIELDKVLLYGSYARNMATEESDIDILVVINTNHIKLSQEIKKISDAIFPFILELGKTISVIPVTKHSFENSQSLFFRNIRKDMQIL